MLDGLTQSRRRTDPEVVEQYAEALRDGDEFPAVDLFTVDGETYYIGDGIHRCDAHVIAGKASIMAYIYKGGLHDAQVFACSANRTHGVHRSNADKRNAVAKMLSLEPKWSARVIADHVGVGDQLVREVRKSLAEEGKIKLPKTVVGRDGHEYETNVKAVSGQVRESRTCVEPANDDFDPDDFEVEGVDIAELAAPYKRAVNDLNRIVRDMQEICEDEKTGGYLADKVVRICKDAESMKAAIRMMEPVAACPDCEGGCKKCAHTGFVTRMMAESKK